MKISELIGSQVLSLSGAKICGVVCGVRLSDNLTRVKTAEVFMSDDDDCERKFIDIRKIRSVGADTVIIMNDGALAPDCPEYTRSPINLPAYSESGEPLGRITDLIVSDDKFTITSICTAEGTFSINDVLSRSDELIVFRLPGSRTRVTSSKTRVPAPRASLAPSDRVTVQSVPETPYRYSFLVGRRPASDVSDTSGRRIAYAGDIITRAVIDDARRRGAIVRLTESCITES